MKVGKAPHHSMPTPGMFVGVVKVQKFQRFEFLKVLLWRVFCVRFVRANATCGCVCAHKRCPEGRQRVVGGLYTPTSLN